VFDREEIARAAALRAAWEAGELRAFLDRQPESRAEYRTLSGIPVKRVYTAEATAGLRHEDLGLHGQYPFTRGPYPTMYRGRLWTMRQIAGFGTGEDNNGRLADLRRWYPGREGLVLDPLHPAHVLNTAINLDRFCGSMTVSPTAWLLLP